MTAPRRQNGVDVERIKTNCTSKNRYSDEFTALAMGITRSEAAGYPLYVYRCRLCSGWHLTKQRFDHEGRLNKQCNEKSFN